MRRFQEKQKIKTRVYSKPMLIGLLILMLLLGKAVANIYMKYRESVEAKRIARAELSELQSRHVALAADIENLESDEGVEEELRKKFNVANPGEKMIVVVEEKKHESETKTKGFWGRFKATVAGWFE